MNNTMDDQEEETLAEDVALRVKHEGSHQLAELRAYLDRHCGTVTDEEFDELLVEVARRALRGESPEDWE